MHGHTAAEVIYERADAEKPFMGLTSFAGELLDGPGKVSHAKAIEKAKSEYRKYQEITLTPVEEEYLKSIKDAVKTAKKERAAKSK